MPISSIVPGQARRPFTDNPPLCRDLTCSHPVVSHRFTAAVEYPFNLRPLQPRVHWAPQIRLDDALRPLWTERRRESRAVASISGRSAQSQGNQPINTLECVGIAS